MAYLITILFSIALAVFGYFLLMTRMRNPQLCALSPPLVVGRMGMAALSLTSEVFFLTICFAEGLIHPFFSLLGFVVTLFRILNFMPTMFILFAVFGCNWTFADKYKKRFDKAFFL